LGKGKQFFIIILILITHTVNARAQSVTAEAAQIKMPQPGIASSTSPVKFKTNLDAFVWGRSIEDKYMSSSAALTHLVPHVTAQYNSWLAFDLQIEGFFVAGNTKNFFSDEGKSSNGLYLAEATGTFTPFTGLTLKGGALNLVLNPIQSILSDNTFLGALEKYEIKPADSPMVLSLQLVEAIPSAGTVTRGLIADSPNAYFLSQTLQAELKIVPARSLLKAASTHYDFRNLSSNVASDGILTGNNPQSFEGLGANTRYTIGFTGFESALSLTTDFTQKWQTELTASLIDNYDGPAEGRTGTQAKLKITRKFDGFNIIPTVGVFSMGADVTPAAYTSISSRNHNRQGYTAKLEVELPRERLKFFGGYIKGDVIKPNPYMADREIFSLGVEAKYDIL
jgi:hypothetical protein